MELGERLRCATGSSELPYGPGLTGARVRRSPAKAVARTGARAGVRAGDHTPTAAVPLLNERLRDAAGGILGLPHRPDVVGRDDGDCKEEIGQRAGARAGVHTPTAAVPLLDQRPAAAVSHSPHIAGRDRRDAEEVGTPRAAGAGDDAPRGAVPVQGERLKGAAGISERAHGPDVVGGDSSDSKQEV